MRRDDCDSEFDDAMAEDNGITCRMCNEVGLHWQEIINAYGFPSLALFNERSRKHECPPPSTEAFKVIPE